MSEEAGCLLELLASGLVLPQMPDTFDIGQSTESFVRKMNLQEPLLMVIEEPAQIRGFNGSSQWVAAAAAGVQQLSSVVLATFQTSRS